MLVVRRDTIIVLLLEENTEIRGHRQAKVDPGQCEYSGKSQQEHRGTPTRHGSRHDGGNVAHLLTQR